MLSRPTLRDRAYIHMRGKILGGDFGPDGRISEWAISRELQISRAPVREAINQLASEGLLKQMPHIGAFVRQPTPREIRELCDLRMALEVFAVGRAAELCDDQTAHRLNTACDLLRSIGQAVIAGTRPFDRNTRMLLVSADRAIHTAIIDAANLPLFSRSIETTRALSLIGQQSPEATPIQIQTMGQQISIHRQIADAVIAHDARTARLLMVDHIRGARRDLIAFHKLRTNAGP